METQIQFENPGLGKRIKGMLGVDFYRLFHTPLYYIFLAIAAFIPALILGTMGMENPNGNISEALYTNLWNAIASDMPEYAFRDIGGYANMNMVYIFGGIMISIFIGHDYGSGYVKQLFTTHAKKQDYVISKTLIGAFSMASMCVTYMMGAIAAGLLVGLESSVNEIGLLCAVLGKLVLSLGWSALFTFLNVIFRKYFGISIASSFFFGTGILVVGLAMAFGNSSLWNVFLYGSSVYACLSATPVTLLVCVVCSLGWMALYLWAGTKILCKSDVY